MKLPSGISKLGTAVVFQAPSSSRDNVVHYVLVFDNELGVQCTCEGWRFTGHCKHVDAIPIEKPNDPS